MMTSLTFDGSAPNPSIMYHRHHVRSKQQSTFLHMTLWMDEARNHT
jgi:hypothetical protein